jgi:HEAT repeat protein
MRSLLFIFLPIALVQASFTEEEGVRRVRAHLLIEDSASALKEALELVDQYPQSKVSGSILIEALAAEKRESEALAVWHSISVKYPDLIQDRALLEELAWGVLRKGLDSTQTGVRLSALIGAYLTRDVRAVQILKQMMRDSNAVIRSIAVQMTPAYQDASLKEEVIHLLENEKVWMVRLEVIKVIGALRIGALKPYLEKMIGSEKVTYEERQIAIESFLQLEDDLSLEKLTLLTKSNRAGMRHLACSIAIHLESKEAKDLILPLIHDSHPDVKVAALNAFALCYKDLVSSYDAIELLSQPLQDSHPTVQVTAAWAATLVDASFGSPHLKRLAEDRVPETRRLAAAAIAASGARGVSLAQEQIRENTDPYVKANVALGLLGQRVDVALACDALHDSLQNDKKMWMWDTKANPLFQVLAPSQIRYVDHIPNYPESIDQMTRLNLVGLLTIVEDPRALTILKDFLQKRSWGITGVAAAMLLQEGDETALEVVRQLLSEEDQNVRLQACLVLAMLGKDESVLSDLQGAYAGADHQKKLHILEALGRMGGGDSYSFFIGVFKEPFPILRVAAAASLIQCLNR